MVSIQPDTPDILLHLLDKHPCSTTFCLRSVRIQQIVKLVKQRLPTISRQQGAVSNAIYEDCIHLLLVFKVDGNELNLKVSDSRVWQQRQTLNNEYFS